MHDTEDLYNSVPDEEPFGWMDLPEEIALIVMKSPSIRPSQVDHYRPVGYFDRDHVNPIGLIRFEKKYQFHPDYNQEMEYWIEVTEFEDEANNDTYLLRPTKARLARLQAHHAVQGGASPITSQRVFLDTLGPSSRVYQPQPHEQEAPTTPIVEILYDTHAKKFYALTPEQLEQTLALEKNVDGPRQALQDSLVQSDTQDKTRRDHRQNALAALKNLTDNHPDNLVEVIHLLHTSKWGYINKKRVNTFQYVWDHSEIITDVSPAIAPKLEGKLKKKSHGELDVHLITGAVDGNFNQWAETINTTPDTTLFKNPDFLIDTHTRVMRYALGASISGNYHPLQHAFTFQADTEDRLTLYDGTLRTKTYFPAKGKGKDFKFQDEAGNALELGYFQTVFELDLHALSGASVELSAALAFGLETDKTHIKGIKTNGEAESFFAGAKGGCDVSGLLNWANPESLTPPTDQSKRYESNTSKGNLKHASFQKLAKVGGGADAAVGVGEGEKFKITYNAEGVFHIICSIEAVAGVGFMGRFCVEIDAETIEHFVQFLYHQIKNHNYHYTGLFLDAAYAAWVGIITVAVWAGEKLESYCQNGLIAATKWFAKKFTTAARTAELERQLIKNILANESLVKFAPPETKGRWLYILCQRPTLSKTYWQYDVWHRQQAIKHILSYIQSEKEYHTALKNMVDTTPDNIGGPIKKISVARGRFLLWESVDSVTYIGTELRVAYDTLEHGLDEKLKKQAQQYYEQAQYRAVAYKAFQITRMV